MAEVKAIHRFARISSTKVRHFARLIQGKTAQDGLNQLRYLHNRGAKMLEKVLKSAIANAEDLGARNPSSLKIKSAIADGGPMYKRLFPRSRGQAAIMRTRFSHIHVVLEVPEGL
jgi:large subunit ribosomal protein L22